MNDGQLMGNLWFWPQEHWNIVLRVRVRVWDRPHRLTGVRVRV